MFRGEDAGSTGGPDRGAGDRRSAERTTEAAELLERAVGYALGAARFVTPALLRCPTPCAGWDLEALMAHVDDSLAALHEGIEDGAVALPGHPRAPGTARQYGHLAAHRNADPAAAFRRRAAGLLGAWLAEPEPARRLVHVADSPMTAAAVALTGAVEITVHGWDIARSTGRTDLPVPHALAVELLPVARHLVPYPEIRHPLFAPEFPVSPHAPPGDRLVGYLGRDPSGEVR